MLMKTEKSYGANILDRRPYERNFADPSTLADFDVVFAGSNKKLKEAKVLQSEEPRRISSMAVSERVAAERGEKLGEIGPSSTVCRTEAYFDESNLEWRALFDLLWWGTNNLYSVTSLGKHHYMVGTPLKICKRSCDAGSTFPSVVCAAPASAVMHVLFLEVVRKDDAGNVIVQCKSNWLHFITVYLQEVNGKMMLLVVDIPIGSRWN
ncbi:hypothetical protein C5167_003976 [Papaver somniferum]|nr:hypothetical protein C5167_003976 [Papaver somniferum]